jgi:alpha-glucosidase
MQADKGETMSAQTSKDIRLTNGGTLRVQVLTPQTFRIRLRQDGRFPEPAMIRYGILRADWPEVPVTIDESETAVTFQTAAASLAVDRASGQVTLRNAEGQVLTQDRTPPWSDAERGFGAEFSLADGERLYGLGDVTRDRIQKRGYKTIMWVRNVASYVPIPYVMSSRGWALFLNTTWRHYFDLGATQPDRLRFFGQRGELDYYLFVGPDYPTLLNLYTDVAGKPHLLPQWGYALTFVCNQQANAREMLDDCLNFRREGIPCDLVGLEPGWMEKHYDFSTEKKWHPERFYLPYWAPKGPQTFLGAAERLGFKVSLWLCCDYDLTFEEERRAGAAGHPQEQTTPPHPDDF